MKFTTVSKEEHLKEYMDIKKIILDFESGVSKDMDCIRKMLEQLHEEIKSIERMIL